MGEDLYGSKRIRAILNNKEPDEILELTKKIDKKLEEILQILHQHVIK